MDEERAIAWNDVRPIAEEAFNIWSGQPEMRWAEQAWGHLTEAGLVNAAIALERVRVYVRLLVLASLYRDWCKVACDEIHDDSPQVWLSAVEVSPLHIGQLVGPNEELSEEDEDDLSEALNILMRRERRAVVKAVVSGFGGADGLFVALWQSDKNWGQQSLFDDEEDEAEPEDYAAVLNNVTDEKMAGYQWVRDGCEFLGPTRMWGEMD